MMLSTEMEPATWQNTRSAFCNCEHYCWRRYPDICQCKDDVCRNDKGWACGCIQKRGRSGLVKVNKPGTNDAYWRWKVA